MRRLTQSLCAPLTAEDMVIQSMPDVSPPKWHLAHTTWFFETFILAPNLPGYRPFHPRYGYLFNSYYNQIGPFHARARRGLLARPTTDEVLAYRAHVDRHLTALLDTLDAAGWARLTPLLELGLNHEQQHQELLLMDVKHNFHANPLRPAYREDLPQTAADTAAAVNFLSCDGGMVRDRTRRAGLRLRQRNTAPPRFPAAVSSGRSPGHLWRISRLHHRRRLSNARTVAVGRLGHRAGARLDGAAVLGAGR